MFNGTWNEVKKTNIEEILKKMGYNWAVRKVAIAMGMTLVIKGIPAPSEKERIGVPLRSAFSKVMRTKSECTPKIVTDHMGVHSKKQKGPHGSAFNNLLGTTWDCTPKTERDYMGVHSLKQKGPHGSALVSQRDQMGVHS